MKYLIYTAIVAATCLFTGCSNIEEKDRLIEVDIPVVAGKKNVLIEDYTGQHCNNCPKATDLIEKMKAGFGEEHIIAVGIHSGPLGFKGNENSIGLVTDLGDRYFKHWGVEAQPQGVIGRTGTPVVKGIFDWPVAAETILSQDASVDLKAESEVDGQQLKLKIKTQGLADLTTGKLQIWITEDGIVAEQIMPNGVLNKEYVHNHVLRAAVNGDWGDPITVAKGEIKTNDYTFTLDKSWVVKNLHLVVFVYNEEGVAQVIQVPFIKE